MNRILLEVFIQDDGTQSAVINGVFKRSDLISLMTTCEYVKRKIKKNLVEAGDSIADVINDYEETIKSLPDNVTNIAEHFKVIPKGEYDAKTKPRSI